MSDAVESSGLASRRHFGRTIAGIVAASAIARYGIADEKSQPKKLSLGIDNFAVRAMDWKAPALIDYAASLEVDSLFITDFGALEKFDDSYLEGIKAKATDKGLQLYLGTWSICPSSTTFRNTWGTAEEHLSLGIRMAQALGSPVLRVILGHHADRLTQGGIDARIADTVRVLKACRGKAIDANVKIAVENHAGDMRSSELVDLIEQAGKDYVGANIDSGNATWTMELPIDNLENLGPYVVCSSLRDSAIWETVSGAAVQWTAMGDGDIDLKAYFRRFAELCPTGPVHIETISGFNRDFPYFNDDYWKPWPQLRAKDFARFAAKAKQGQPRQAWTPPAGVDRKQAEQEFQKADVAKSIRYCKQELGLGRR